MLFKGDVAENDITYFIGWRTNKWDFSLFLNGSNFVDFLMSCGCLCQRLGAAFEKDCFLKFVLNFYLFEKNSFIVMKYPV